ncbi:BMP family ABC transporter substrate-binding protein [Mycoplasmatota bacterium zrk1]
MKKLLSLLTVLALVLTLVACASKEDTYELALVTDVGTIDDKSFNQGAWEGLVKYAEEKNIDYNYYQPTAKTTDEYVAAIDLAVKGGAKNVVTPGYLFENAIYVVQDKYPEVNFIILDGSAHNVVDWDTMATMDDSEVDFRLEDNVYSIFYKEQESGFLAGYAAVKDGYTELGFMGGMAVPAVVRFGYGFVQGADHAAEEMGVDVNVKYHYTGVFWPTDEVQNTASAWYQGGTEVIFAAAGGAGNSVMKAAEQNDGKAIGVDVDQSAESTTVITSAKKELAESVYQCLTEIYNETSDFFIAGESVVMSVNNNGVGLPSDFSRFESFTEAQYQEVFDYLKNPPVELASDAISSVADVPVNVATVEIVE